MDTQKLSSLVDLKTFDKILELDDNEDRLFTQSLAEEYFQLALSYNSNMTADLHALEYKNLSFKAQRLSESSVAMGFIPISSTCRTIADDAMVILEASDAISMQKQRLLLRQQLNTLHNQVKRTQVVVAEYFQQLLTSRRQGSQKHAGLCEAFSKLLST